MNKKVLIVKSQSKATGLYFYYIVIQKSLYFRLYIDNKLSHFKSYNLLIKNIKKHKNNIEKYQIPNEVFIDEIANKESNILKEYNSIDELINDNIEHLI